MITANSALPAAGVKRELASSKREFFLRSKFENLITSVEVGLEKVPGPKGAEQLVEVLARRSPTRNSKRYLAQLFTLLSDGQPTAQIRSLIGARSQLHS